MNQELPEKHEVNLWTADAPDGKTWLCGECGHWASLGGNAAYHALQTGHGPPELWTIPEDVATMSRPAKPAKPPEDVLAVRVGDFMVLGDDLRLVIQIAETALSLAQQYGAPLAKVVPLQRLLNRV